MNPAHETLIYLMHKHAAELEIEAAQTRLDTARREADSAQRTLAMADEVATRMLAASMRGEQPTGGN